MNLFITDNYDNYKHDSRDLLEHSRSNSPDSLEKFIDLSSDDDSTVTDNNCNTIIPYQYNVNIPSIILERPTGVKYNISQNTNTLFNELNLTLNSNNTDIFKINKIMTTIKHIVFSNNYQIEQNELNIHLKQCINNILKCSETCNNRLESLYKEL